MSGIKQDMPPKGGYPPIRIRKNPGYGKKFWAGGTLLIVSSAAITYGFYRWWVGVNKEKELKDEKNVLQTAMTPFLQAERDIALTVQHRAFLKKVQQLMADMPNFNAHEKFYHSDKRYVRPLYDVDVAQFKNTKFE